MTPHAVRLPLVRRGEPRPQRFALVDVADYQRFCCWSWFVDMDGYVMRQQGRRGEQLRKFYLHREILGLPFGDARCGDHIDGDPLNNRRANLRAVTKAQNNQNKRRRRGGTSKYTGVAWVRANRKWQAYGRRDGRAVYLGLYDNEDEAGRVAAAWRRKHMPFFVPWR